MRFFHLLTDLAVPKSLFGLGNYRLAKAAARPYPFAVKRGSQTQQPEGDEDTEIPEKRWKTLF